MKRKVGVLSEILKIFVNENRRILPWITSSQFCEDVTAYQNSVALVGTQNTPPASDISVTDFLTELRDVPFLWGSKGGVPKRKGSFERQRARHSGMHFKWCHLRLKPWYVCPLCGEPKEAEQVCRKEICRRVRP